MQLKVDPNRSHVRVTNIAQFLLREIGVSQTMRARRRDVVKAAKTFEPMGGVYEVHWLAKAVIDGQDVVLLLAKHPGAPWGDRDETVSVRGAFTPEHAAELLAQGNGLPPFIQYVKEANAYYENN